METLILSGIKGLLEQGPTGLILAVSLYWNWQQNNQLSKNNESRIDEAKAAIKAVAEMTSSINKLTETIRSNMKKDFGG